MVMVYYYDMFVYFIFKAFPDFPEEAVAPNV